MPPVSRTQFGSTNTAETSHHDCVGLSQSAQLLERLHSFINQYTPSQPSHSIEAGSQLLKLLTDVTSYLILAEDHNLTDSDTSHHAPPPTNSPTQPSLSSTSPPNIAPDLSAALDKMIPLHIDHLSSNALHVFASQPSDTFGFINPNVAPLLSDFVAIKTNSGEMEVFRYSDWLCSYPLSEFIGVLEYTIAIQPYR